MNDINQVLIFFILSFSNDCSRKGSKCKGVYGTKVMSTEHSITGQVEQMYFIKYINDKQKITN